MPTGGGKTVIFAAIANEFVTREERVLVLAHREELITQAGKKLEAVTGSPVGIIKAGYKPNPLFPVQVASVQSMVKRLNWFEDFGLVVIDEAHHATAKTYRKILEAYPNAYQLGVTATPIRTDKTGFKDLFDTLVTGPTVRELTDWGHLSRFKLFADPNPMTTKGVKTRQGDYSASDLAEANPVIELSGNLINSYRQYANGKRCVVFSVNVEHSQAIAARYNQAGITAAHLDGTTPSEERRETLEQFRQGRLKIISNCQLFDEGLDIPALEAIQIAKPTKSLSRWLQMVGRALRPAPGKDYAVLIDHTKNWAIHGLPTRPRFWTLDGVEEPEDKKKRIERNPETGEILEIDVVEQETVLEEIEETTVETTAIADEWMIWFQDLLYRQQSYGLKPGWVYYRLVEAKPPLHIWKEYEKLRGYRRGWAKCHFEEQEGIQEDVSASEPDWHCIWQEVINQLSPILKALFSPYAHLVKVENNEVFLSARSEGILKLMRTRISEVEMAFRQVTGQDLSVKLIVATEPTRQ